MSVLHDSLTLDLNADCAEFCPAAGSDALLAVGTYELVEATQERRGRLYLFDTNAARSEDTSISGKLKCVATRDFVGIFDHKWVRPGDAPPVGASAAHEHLRLGLALADGSFQLVQVTKVKRLAACFEACSV